MAASRHFDFFKIHIISNYSLNSNCNTSKWATLRHLNAIFDVLFKKNQNCTPQGVKFQKSVKNNRKWSFFHMIIILSTSALLDINKFTFSIENDSISSKLIAKQGDNAIYRYPQGVKYPHFDQK